MNWKVRASFLFIIVHLLACCDKVQKQDQLAEETKQLGTQNLKAEVPSRPPFDGIELGTPPYQLGAQVRSHDSWPTSISNAKKPNGEPDIVVHGKYEWDGLYIRADGSAKLNEDSVIAWDINGILDKKLANEIELSLDKSASRPFQFKRNRKNRFVVVRQKVRLPFVPMESGHESSFSLVRKIGNELPASNFEYLSSRPLGNERPPTDLEHTYLVGADFDRTQKTAEVMFSHREEISGPSSIVPKVGQTANKDGVKVEVLYVGVHLKTNEPAYMSSRHNSFDIKLSLTGKRQLMSLKAIPLDREGRVIEWMNALGEPVYPTKHELMYTDWNKLPDEQRPRSVAFRRLGFLSQANELVFSSSIDPKHVSSLSLKFSALKFVKLTGIPLDPKPVSIE
jgi:hypothetical protein